MAENRLVLKVCFYTPRSGSLGYVHENTQASRASKSCHWSAWHLTLRVHEVIGI